MDKASAERLLQKAVGSEGISFREGQWEAIDALANKRNKLLVVQRTGWGKSSVYFISTRILRDNGSGPTLIISPLLALMRNQILQARRLKIRAERIDSTNKDDWPSVQAAIKNNAIDCLLISPERLANEDFLEGFLGPIAADIGLLVVDEAHCISDWGHDFRPDYRRIVNILRQMPENMPVLATTATANNRVVSDIGRQLGQVQTLRGTLARKSLRLDAIQLPGSDARFAWLAENVPKLPSSGIIYTLTKRDADQVSGWLQMNGVEAAPYYSGVGESNSIEYREILEDKLLNNEIKAVVATSALGMGFDKPDLGFVIHFQAPGSVVAYYQQVGRAGRAIDNAYGILLAGQEDSDILEYFRRTAFPKEDHIRRVIDCIEQSETGLTKAEVEQAVNLRPNQIAHVLKFLNVENPAPILKQGRKWVALPKADVYRLDADRIQFLTEQREQEWRQIEDYVSYTGCRMSFLANALDDASCEDCGRCANCDPKNRLSHKFRSETGIAAVKYLRKGDMPLKPRRLIPGNALPIYDFPRNLSPDLIAEHGRILSSWEDAGWGRTVAQNKRDGYFQDVLVEAAAELIEKRWRPVPKPTWVTCVPSYRNPDLVPSFAKRLADQLQLDFIEIIHKTQETEQQKMMNNSFHQCQNLDGVFELTEKPSHESVLLVDDVVDSKWTTTVISALLRSKGSGKVFPFALANSFGG